MMKLATFRRLRNIFSIMYNVMHQELYIFFESIYMVEAKIEAKFLMKLYATNNVLSINIFYHSTWNLDIYMVKILYRVKIYDKDIYMVFDKVWYSVWCNITSWLPFRLICVEMSSSS